MYTWIISMFGGSMGQRENYKWEWLQFLDSTSVSFYVYIFLGWICLCFQLPVLFNLIKLPTLASYLWYNDATIGMLSLDFISCYWPNLCMFIHVTNTLNDPRLKKNLLKFYLYLLNTPNHQHILYYSIPDGSLYLQMVSFSLPHFHSYH